MSVENLDKAKLKQILKTSQGFPSQFESSKARVKTTAGGRVVSPSRAGHAVSSHVRGAMSTQYKTKFCSIDDMAEALALVLETQAGKRALAQLRTGHRETVEADIRRPFPIEAELDGFGPVTFSRRDLSAAHMHRLHCVAVLEGRLRASEMYLHVQTFYPKIDSVEMNRLLNAKTAP